MGSLVLMGGCLLGLLGLEWARRNLFPGHPPPSRWWTGRSRSRGSRLGGPDHRTALLHQSSETLDSFFSNSAQLAEEQLRKALLESRSATERVRILCLLSDLASRKGERQDCLAFLEEAEEALRSDWKPLDRGCLQALEALLRTKTLAHLQEGAPAESLQCLQESESVLGLSPWGLRVRSECHLLAGRTDEALSDLTKLESLGWDKSAEFHLLRAECHLRARDYDALDWSLKAADLLSPYPDREKVIAASLRIERALHDGSIASAWRAVGVIHECLSRKVGDTGFRRAFHLGCARVHLAEGDLVEAHRHLQLAENNAPYPVALWDVHLLLGAVLEAEDRTEEARAVWERLISEARGTYFAGVAEARLLRQNPPRCLKIPGLETILK